MPHVGGAMERRLAAILAADVVGYSRLMQADEEATLRALRDHQKTVLEPAITRAHGRVVKLMGDGVLAEFPSVVDAVNAALAIQETAVTGQYSQAETEALRAIAANSTFPTPYLSLAAARYNLGRFDEAKSALARHHDLRPVYRLGLLAHSFSAGRDEAFRRWVEERYLEPLRRLGLPD